MDIEILCHNARGISESEERCTYVVSTFGWPEKLKETDILDGESLIRGRRPLRDPEAFQVKAGHLHLSEVSITC